MFAHCSGRGGTGQEVRHYISAERRVQLSDDEARLLETRAYIPPHIVRKLITGSEGGVAAPRQGRTIGSGTFAIADEPLLREMRKLIGSGHANSPHGAARLVAERARGNATFESKVARLARAYRSRFPEST